MNRNKLETAMKEKGVTNLDMCQYLKMSRTAFYRKRTGKTEFTQSEIQKIVDYLGLRSPMDIFFDEKVS